MKNGLKCQISNAYSLKFIWFVVFLLGLSMGRIGSDLDLTRTQPDWIWLPKMWPATTPIYELNPAVQVIGWTGQIHRLGRFGLRIGPNLWICMNFFYSIFDRPFGPKLMGLLLTNIYIFLNNVYISYGPLFTSFISKWAFKLSLYAIANWAFNHVF